MSKIKKMLALVLSVVSLFSILTFNASAKDWRTGEFGSGSYRTVYLDNTKKAGYITVYTYNCLKGNNHAGACGAAATETYGAKLTITLRDKKGNWICDFDTTCRTKLKLGNDHSAYRVYINTRKGLSTSAKWINDGKCTHWSLETTSNTKF